MFVASRLILTLISCRTIPVASPKLLMAVPRGTPPGVARTAPHGRTAVGQPPRASAGARGQADDAVGDPPSRGDKLAPQRHQRFRGAPARERSARASCPSAAPSVLRTVLGTAVVPYRLVAPLRHGCARVRGPAGRCPGPPAVLCARIRSTSACTRERTTAGERVIARGARGGRRGASTVTCSGAEAWMAVTRCASSCCVGGT